MLVYFNTKIYNDLQVWERNTINKDIKYVVCTQFLKCGPNLNLCKFFEGVFECSQEQIIKETAVNEMSFVFV
jgi:hypothetical protein